MEGNPLRQVYTLVLSGCKIQIATLSPRCVPCGNSNLFLQELVAELLKWHFKEKSTKSQLCAFLISSSYAYKHR